MILESWVDIRVEASDRVGNWDLETLDVVIDFVRVDEITKGQK